MTINDAMGSMPGKRHGLDRTLTCNDFCKDFYINFRSSFSLNEKIIFIKRPMTNFYFFLLYELVIKLCSLLKNRAEMRAKQGFLVSGFWFLVSGTSGFYFRMCWRFSSQKHPENKSWARPATSLPLDEPKMYQRFCARGLILNT